MVFRSAFPLRSFLLFAIHLQSTHRSFFFSHNYICCCLSLRSVQELFSFWRKEKATLFPSTSRCIRSWIFQGLSCFYHYNILHVFHKIENLVLLWLNANQTTFFAVIWWNIQPSDAIEGIDSQSWTSNGSWLRKKLCNKFCKRHFSTPFMLCE